MERISALRGACLTRDRHRCVVTRKFDRKEALKRIKTARGDACDDDGNQLARDRSFETLEVCHILPHSLTTVGRGNQELVSQRSVLLGPFHSSN